MRDTTWKGALRAAIESKVTRQKRGIVAIDGSDASGKTTIAQGVAQLLRDMGHEARVVAIDDFHAPRDVRYAQGRDSAKGFYEDSYNYQTFITQVLEPYKAGANRIMLQCYNLNEEAAEEKYTDVGEHTWLVAEGIFLQRPELRKYWDIVIYLQVSEYNSLWRNLRRTYGNAQVPEDAVQRYNKRYIAGQRLYRQACNPEERADILINNDDTAGPAVITGESLLIRPARQTDSSAICVLLRQMGYADTEDHVPQRLQRMLIDEDEYLVMAELHGRAVGFMSVHIIPMVAYKNDFAQLNYLVVDESVRGLGVGKRLLAHCEDIARNRHCDRIQLHSSMKRERAHSFYLREGYEEWPQCFVKYLRY